MRKPVRTKTNNPIKKRTLVDEALESVYERLSQLLSRHAPPFRFKDFDVRDKKGVQIVVPRPVAIPGAYGGKPVNLQGGCRERG